MIIFNITFHIEDDIHDQAILFLKDSYIAKAINSGYMFQPRLAFIHKQHEEAGSSYSLQFNVKNMDTLNLWHSIEGQKLYEEIGQRFGNKMLGFTTILEEIEIM